MKNSTKIQWKTGWFLNILFLLCLLISGGASTSAYALSVERVDIYDMQSKLRVGTLVNGASYKLGGLPVALVATISGRTQSTSVRLALSGPVSQTKLENSQPFSLFGDDQYGLKSKVLSAGSYRLVVRPYSGQNLSGTAGSEYVVNFSLTTSVTPSTVSGAKVYPNSTNTGVPQSVVLRSCGGTISQPGIFDGCLFSSGVYLTSDNVTIRRSKILGTIMGDASKNFYNVLLEDVEVDGQNNKTFPAIGINGYTCRRCKVHNTMQCFRGTGYTIESSYCYNLYGWGDPATTGSHNETLIASSTRPIIIRNSNLVANWNAATTGGGMSGVVAIYSHGTFWGPVGNVTVEGNRLESTGGSYYCIYTGQTNYGPTGVKIVNNLFISADANYNRGCRGAYPDWVRGGGNQWYGNVNEFGVTIPEPPSYPITGP